MNRLILVITCSMLLMTSSLFPLTIFAGDKPHIVLIMTDDQGWGQTGYYKHPVLKTPNLDAMAANGLRFDRFYAGAPVCSPTRASVLTGRFCERSGVPSHGHALRLQEKTLPAALKAAGYATGHFGKWHLNALRGPGVPILKDDANGPKAFGFETWISVTNFFEVNPLMSDHGEFTSYKGDSSDVIVSLALAFIEANVKADKPTLSVIWDGSPHSPFVASEADMADFKGMDDKSRQHYGEVVAFDRSVGKLRQGLKDLGIQNNTLVWFCSDNGGLSGMKPDTVGGLRGHKGSVFEGGVRVPGIIEWPAKIKPRVTSHPSSTMDIFPTIVALLGLDESVMLQPVDGMSLVGLFDQEIGPRAKPLGFRFLGNHAWIDNDYKYVHVKGKGKISKTPVVALYDLKKDPAESNDISKQKPEIFERLKKSYEAWAQTVENSIAGKDYPEGKVLPGPKSHFWRDDERYEPYRKTFQELGLLKQSKPSKKGKKGKSKAEKK